MALAPDTAPRAVVARPPNRRAAIGAEGPEHHPQPAGKLSRSTRGGKMPSSRSMRRGWLLLLEQRPSPIHMASTSTMRRAFPGKAASWRG